MTCTTRFVAASLLAVAGLVGPAAGQDAPFPPASPESQGLTAESLDALDAAVRGYVEKGYAVGAELLVIKDRRTVLHEVHGLADREAKRPWTIGTVCNIRSMTKPLTGAALQILIERGRIGLDDPVSKHLPGFDTDASRAITVRQVLTHRSGLPLTILTEIDEYPDLQAQANAAGARGPEFEPESKFWYSDIGTDVVAALVEAVSGRSLDAFVADELLTPLGMTDSFYGTDATDPRFERIASLYVGAANAWVRFWTAEDGKPFYPFAWGSQTIYSTPADYARFLAMWMDEGAVGEGRVLAADTVRRALTPVSPMTMLGSDERFPTELRGLEVHYGEMAVLHCPVEDPGAGPVVIGHSGSDGTIAWAWPERDLMVLYFTQSRGGTTALRLETEIDRLLLHPGEAVAAAPIPPELAPFIGTYIANFASFENEPFEVLVKNGRLALDIPSQMVFELLDPDEEGRRAFALAPDQVQVTFERDETGRAVLLRLHQAGSVFEIPRKGTALAEEMSRPIVVAPETLASLVGTYHDPEADRLLEIFLDDGGVLNIKAPPNLVLQLRPTRTADLWQVKQSPAVTLSFQRGDDGTVVSMTRHIGEQTLVMSRRTADDRNADDEPSTSDPAR